MAEPADLDPVAAREAPIRLDAFVAARLGCGRRRALELVRLGLVRVAGELERQPSTRLASGARVSVAEAEVSAPPPSSLPPPRVVYQDELIAVVDKPAGVVVHPAPSHTGPTLVDFVRGWGGSWSRSGGDQRPGIVHRLDRGTSGLLVLARTDEAHLELARQLRTRQLGREYWALSRGHFREDRGRIEAAIGRDPAQPRRMAVTRQGRDAATEFFVLERLPDHTVLRLRLLSGRTHQIRVHLSYIGRPLEGDWLYGTAKDRSQRPALHAAMLHLRHPGSGQEMTFWSPLPPELEELRGRLGGAGIGPAGWPWQAGPESQS